jgi:uncharacterized protein
MRKFVPMTGKDSEIARQLKERLLEETSLLDFRLFGSRARGDCDDDSDMDIFIEVPELEKSLKEKISDITWEVGLEHFMVITLLVFTRHELKNTPLRSSPIVEMIMKEGIVL